MGQTQASKARCVHNIFAALALALIITGSALATGAEEVPSWTIALRPGDAVIGDALERLPTRRKWTTRFDERLGGFEIALKKKAAAIPAPHCRMDYLILTIPFYYPENPKQASVGERRAVYDAFVALQARGSGRLTVRVEAPLGLARKEAGRVTLTACNLYFAFPPSVQVSAP